MCGRVVATGGGAVLRAENRARLADSGLVIYLNVPLQTLCERTRHDKNRPLLQVSDPLLKLKELHERRDPLYRSIADLVVSGSRITVAVSPATPAQGNEKAMETLTVALGERAYPIHVGRGLIDSGGLLLPFLRQPKVAIVSNTTVAPLVPRAPVGVVAAWQELKSSRSSCPTANSSRTGKR
jgi:shikimate kinase/3-dehydroquinate synthase